MKLSKDQKWLIGGVIIFLGFCILFILLAQKLSDTYNSDLFNKEANIISSEYVHFVNKSNETYLTGVVASKPEVKYSPSANKLYAVIKINDGTMVVKTAVPVNNSDQSIYIFSEEIKEKAVPGKGIVLRGKWGPKKIFFYFDRISTIRKIEEPKFEYRKPVPQIRV